ncbi:transglutaminase family protein [Paenibacillus sacheonensis]|uniref:Transglutaminase family protein n=1 Tax=Paenibacillus sacheonensis TaxID=742054 RepID=A0A7X4YNR5_9BACL|nr:transglutaminase family protein [Paenibacillus sacheonensis]MBM7565370.1 transglutaminase-like putative cysteine protease [Paenibacillus sacheonensis]NBC69702.1 transglutaminase family protein [Paenibacillus sacheonensis]
MKLHISHTTQYAYKNAVTDSVNELRLTPFTNEQQSCYQHAIAVEPNASLFSYDDYFGNRVHVFSVNHLHRKLTIRSQMTVVTREALRPPRGKDVSPPKEAWDWLTSEKASNRFAEYLIPTEYTGITPELAAFAQATIQNESGEDRLGVYSWLLALSNKIRSEFVYDTAATNVHTIASDMLHRRRGVCQDFAHLMIASCRSKGVPARYVSGYHFVGDLQGGSADFEQASHAWVEAYVPGMGWCGFDPTNDALVGERYVKLGHGRDYKDIVPVKGVYMGTGEADLKVTVDVRRVD